MEAAFSAVIDFFRESPGSGYAIVFLAALAESLAIVGMLVPGVLVMLAAGALIGDGVLQFWPAAALAVIGAILGDSLSFYLGYRYRTRLRDVWPFNRHPAPLDRGIAFFSHHGSKSVILGRFVGPVRAIVPLVAGMLDMPPKRFALANIGSALVWAPAYLAPGILFGASLKLASEAATGLVFVALGLASVMALMIWLTRTLVLWASAKSTAWVSAALRWANVHPVMGHIAAALADSNHPDAAVLSGLAFALLLATVLMGLSLSAVLAGPEQLAINQLTLDLGHSLAAPSIDPILAAISLLGEPALLFVLAAAIFAYLRWCQRGRDAAYWISAAGFALIASPLLGQLIGTARPPLENGAAWQLPWPWSFPTPPILGAVLIYGFLALLIARALPSQLRWIPAALVSCLIGALGFVRLYFGTEWLTDLVASATLGLAWLAALGLAFSRHTKRANHAWALVLIAAAVLIPGYLVMAIGKGAATLAQHRPAAPVTWIQERQWHNGEPAELPQARLDLWRKNRQPFDLQYAGALDNLERALLDIGWQPVETLNFRNALRLFSRSAALADLPMLRHVHQGQLEALIVARDSSGGARQVLRLWHTNVAIDGAGPLWIGDITRVDKDAIAGLLVVPITAPGSQPDTRTELAQQLAAQGDFLVDENSLLRIRLRPALTPPSAAPTDGAHSGDPESAPP